jgi:hypothetical protein
MKLQGAVLFTFVVTHMDAGNVNTVLHKLKL